MTTQTEILSLDSLDYLPFLDENGSLCEEIQSKIGVYAILIRTKFYNLLVILGIYILV